MDTMEKWSNDGGRRYSKDNRGVCLRVSGCMSDWNFALYMPNGDSVRGHRKTMRAAREAAEVYSDVYLEMVKLGGEP
jgi:hypothetical protein